MSCEQMRELLSGHLDGGNSKEQEAVLSAHLAQCPDCRRLLAEYTQMDRELAGLACPPPPGLSRSVMEAICQTPQPPKAQRRLTFRYGTAIAAAAAVLVLAFGIGKAKLATGGSADLTSAMPMLAAPDEMPAPEAAPEPAPEPAPESELAPMQEASDAEALPANVDCAALAQADGCPVGLLYAELDALPELSEMQALPLSGGVRYTITQAKLLQLREQFVMLQIYEPESYTPDDSASAYLIVVKP